MSFLNTYARYPIRVVRGQGPRVQDHEGRWYLDAISGIGVNTLGHGHPALLAAVHAQVDRLVHISNLFHVDVQTELAALLTATYGAGGVFLCNSGAEANEAAIKLVRKYHFSRGEPRHELIVLENAFHGRTLATLAMTPRVKYQAPFGPLPAGVRAIAASQVAAAVGPNTAAVFVEPVQGEGGCHPVAELAEIREACDRHGALLVYDEIQCGLGRTGTLLHDPRPDILTLAKPLGGGFPLGAVVASPLLADTFTPGDHGSTFGGNPVACAAGLVVLKTVLADDLAGRARVLGARLRAGLEATGARVTGAGLMLAAWVDQPAGPVIDAMRARGVLTCPAGPDAVRFLPPLIVDEQVIDLIVDVFGAAWQSVR